MPRHFRKSSSTHMFFQDVCVRGLRLAKLPWTRIHPIGKTCCGGRWPEMISLSPYESLEGEAIVPVQTPGRTPTALFHRLLDEVDTVETDDTDHYWWETCPPRSLIRQSWGNCSVYMSLDSNGRGCVCTQSSNSNLLCSLCKSVPPSPGLRRQRKRSRVRELSCY